MKAFCAISALLLCVTGPTFAQPGGTAPAMHPIVMTLSSPAFESGAIIPDKYTAKGATPNMPAPSPALNWIGTPAGTQSYVLIMHDIDVVVGKGTSDNLHWLAFNIPGNATSLPEGVPTVAQMPDGTVQPKNRNRNGYGGPGAPPGIYHHYIFELWALDTKLSLDTDVSREQVLQAMDGHVLDKGSLVGRFHR